MRTRTIVVLGAVGAVALVALFGTGKLAVAAVGRAEQSNAGWTWPWDDKPAAAACANHAFEQCGGKDYAGETCCPEQFTCEADTEFYSQCKDTAATCPNAEHDMCGGPFFFRGDTCCPAGSACKTVVPYVYKKCMRDGECPNQPWDQCGGAGWAGEECCPEHHHCVLQADGAYAQCKPESELDESENDHAWSQIMDKGANLTQKIKEQLTVEQITGVTPEELKEWANDAQAFAAAQMEKMKDAQGEAKADLSEHLGELQAQMADLSAAVAEHEAVVAVAGVWSTDVLPTLVYTKATVHKWAVDSSAQTKRWWQSTSESVHDAWKNRHAHWDDFKDVGVNMWESCGAETESCNANSPCCDALECYEETACIKATPVVSK